MIKDRYKLEETLNKITQDYAHNNKVIDQITNKLVENHNLSRGRVIGMFTQSTPISYFNDTELCLIIKYLYESTGEHKLKPDEWYNQNEILTAEIFKDVSEEKTNRIVLHNVDQINDYQWLCTKETYQNISHYMANGLTGYNMRTQRQPIKKRYGDRIIQVPNIKASKIEAIKQEMMNGTFNANVITWNIRRVTGMEKFKYNSKDRILTIEVGDDCHIDIIDGANRSGAIIKTVEEKSNIDMTTSIMIYHVDEEKARQIIYQEAQAEPLDEEWADMFDVSNVNMEVVKNINTKQRMNEMFNRFGKDLNELKYENKLVTFKTFAETIEYIYDLKKEPFIQAQNVEKFLIELFNVVIGINHDLYNEKLSETRKTSYIADNNMFIGYIALGEELRKQYEDEWKDKIQDILSKMNFDKTNPIWKNIGIENNLNLKTIKKITEYFKNLVLSERCA